MSTDARERSREGSRPVEIYDITMAAVTYRLVDAEKPITVGGFEYNPVAVSRSNIQLGRNTPAETLTITMPSTHAFARQFVQNVPGRRAAVTIRRTHRGEDDSIVIFKGLVQSVAFTLDGSSASVQVVPLQSATGRQIPRFTFQGLCNHALFDARCKVNPALHRHVGVVTATSSSGLVVTVDDLATKGDGWSQGGFIALPTNEFRLIAQQTGNNIRLYFPFPVAPTGVEVEVFAGCAHDLDTCETKFDNVPNYGGFPFVPLKDIFSRGLD